MRTLIITAVLLAVSSSLTSAQSRLQTGERIRIRSHEISGTAVVVENTEESLVVLAGNAVTPRTIAWRNITRIEVQQRRSGWQGARRGAGLGFLFGGLGGAVAGYATGDDECEGFCILTFTAEEKAVLLGVLIGGAGGLVGGVIGAISPGFRWVDATHALDNLHADVHARSVELSYRIPLTF